ncbi:hypothetical protein I4U23_030448 [Adineta vaga]|nr:hypothetical protein I4U23_030448 [Adineta vaga]
MGCTSSNQTGSTKGVTGLSPATITDDGHQLVNEHFRKWLKTNRPQADEYVLNDVLSTAQPSNEAEDYKTIVSKALDLLADRHDIKSTNKLGKLVQKEITLASPKKVAHTITVLKQTADKLRSGSIQLETDQQVTTGELTNVTTTSENMDVQVLSGEPGIVLKEALEKARILFYKGKQAAIFANPRGGYDVRILDENDDTINHDGNLLRSIVVTEVKLRPKITTKTSSTLFSSSPLSTCPPPSKLLDENEITDDFRRSIDAALKGLEAVYHTPPPLTAISENVQEIHTDKPVQKPSSPTPLYIQYGVTNAPIPKSISKEQTALSNDHPPAPVDHTAHLAEIIRQMAEQQKLVAEQISKDDEVVVDLNQDDMNELIMDAIEVTTCSEMGNPLPPIEHAIEEKIDLIDVHEELEGPIERMIKEIKEHGEKFESKESLSAITTSTKQPSSYSLGLTSPLSSESIPTSPPHHHKVKLRSDNRPKSFIANDEVITKDRYHFIKQMSLDELAHLTQTGLSNPNLTTSITKLGISTSSGKIEEEEQMPAVTSVAADIMPTSISQIIEEHRTILDESATTASPPPAVVTPVETQTKIKSPSHNVTYTEIIHSESRDGEQSRRFITESYDENPSNDDEQTTTLKVITKSEFSNHPTSGEKIMEQSVQVITVKVRNETIKTTIQQASVPPTTDNEASYERRPVSELVKNFEVVTGSNGINT